MYFDIRNRETMDTLLTPPMSAEELPTKRRKLFSEEDEDDEAINSILDSYAPLSNLPTPPLSKEASPRPISARGPAQESTVGNFTEAARFMSEIIRIREKSVSSLQASKIERLLARCGLDSHRIAFAACVLYRLSWRFVRDWKNEMLSRDQAACLAEPEMIVLAALYTASSWLDDRPRSVRFWVEDVGRFLPRDAFLGSQICILADPSTSLMSIDEQEMEEMMEDMGLLRAGDEGSNYSCGANGSLDLDMSRIDGSGLEFWGSFGHSD